MDDSGSEDQAGPSWEDTFQMHRPQKEHLRAEAVASALQRQRWEAQTELAQQHDQPWEATSMRGWDAEGESQERGQVPSLSDLCFYGMMQSIPPSLQVFLNI